MKQFNLTILLTILMSVVGAKAFAYDVTVENEDGVMIFYNYINNGTELEVAGSHCRGSVKIPESVTILNKTRKVTRIGDRAFFGCSDLTAITIPGSITSIGDDAFDRCYYLTKVIVKDIGAWCSISFNSDLHNNPLEYAQHLYSDEDTEIVNLVIPEGVTSIGNYAFGDCSGLTSVTIPASVKSFGNRAFSGCSGLKKVIVKDIGAWCGISSNGGTCTPLFYAHHLYSDDDTEITNLVIPEGVTSIGNYAFGNCSGLTSVTIPASITSIDAYAFYKCI